MFYYYSTYISSANLNYSWVKNWSNWLSSSYQLNQRFNYSKIKQSDVDFIKKSNKFNYSFVEDCAFSNGVFYFSPNSYIIIIEVVPKQPKKTNPNAGGPNVQVLNQILNQLTQINTNVMNLQTQVNNLEVKVNNMQVQIDNMQVQIDNMQVQIDKMQVQMDNMQVQIDNIDKRVVILDEKVAILDKKVSILDEKVEKITDAIIELQEFAEQDGKVVTKKLKKE